MNATIVYLLLSAGSSSAIKARLTDHFYMQVLVLITKAQENFCLLSLCSSTFGTLCFFDCLSVNICQPLKEATVDKLEYKVV